MEKTTEEDAQRILDEVTLDIELRRKGIDPIELRKKVEEDGKNLS